MTSLLRNVVRCKLSLSRSLTIHELTHCFNALQNCDRGKEEKKKRKEFISDMFVKNMIKKHESPTSN